MTAGVPVNERLRFYPLDSFRRQSGLWPLVDTPPEVPRPARGCRLTLRRVRDFLWESEVPSAGHIDEQNQGQVSVQYTQVELAHPVDVIVTALNDTIGVLGTHESVTGYL